ncbi:MAG: GntR family transcriptional regulator [Clostridia bacterium]|nr:GntR family transcriptional regulator [Clostridia bacterium]
MQTYLLDYIRAHSLTVGAKLPTEKEMMEHTGVSRVTLRRSLANMQDEKLIYSVQGSGYFVGDGCDALRVDTIPLIISYNHENSKILNIVHGAQSYLEKHHCQLDLRISKKNSEIEKQTLEQLYQEGYRCAIVFPVSSEENADFYFEMIQKGMHLVFIDRKPKGLSCCNLVTCDNMTGGYLATKHLIEQGHRNIVAFGLEPLEHISAVSERYAGYRRALKEHGIPEPPKSYYYAQYRKYNEDIEAILNPENRITAVFAINDHAAVDIATHAYEHGLKVPDSLAVIGFDNLDITAVFSPHLSTIDQPFTQLGEVSAKLAYKILTHAVQGFTQRVLPVKLIIRESTQRKFSLFR